MEEEFLRKINSKHFKYFLEKFKDVDFNIEKNVKNFMEGSRLLFFENKCFFKKFFKYIKTLPKSNENANVDPKILETIDIFVNFLNNEKVRNVRKFYRKVKCDPQFKELDGKFKLKQNKINYDNLISYFQCKLEYLKKKNGNTFTFLLSDDNCVPMYNSKEENSFELYNSGEIKFPCKESYTCMILAFKNGHHEKYKENKVYISEKLGASAQTVQEKTNLSTAGSVFLVFTVIAFVFTVALWSGPLLLLTVIFGIITIILFAESDN